MCTLEDEENLSDHMVEIDILSEIKHKNIVELYEAYSIEDKLWVCVMFVQDFIDFFSNLLIMLIHLWFLFSLIRC
jgi:hypothetical protein